MKTTIKKSPALIFPLLFCFGAYSAQADDFTSTENGDWNAGGTWGLATADPQTGAGDNVTIQHEVIHTGGTVGLDGSGDLGVGNGNTITIDGGILSQTRTGSWVRIGHKAGGTLDIKDGAFYFANVMGDGSNFQVGVETGGEGIVNVGDGTGAAKSAVLDLRHLPDGVTNQNASNHMNIGASGDTFGRVTVNSDGYLVGGDLVRGEGGRNPHIRVGQSSSGTQSQLIVNAGGQVDVGGNLEVAAQGGSKGLLSLNGTNARLDQYDGDFTVGFNGNGFMEVKDGAVYERHLNSAEVMGIYVGRESGPGLLTVEGGGQFINKGANLIVGARDDANGSIVLTGAGSKLEQSEGELNIGLEGKGSLLVEEGAVYQRLDSVTNKRLDLYVGKKTEGEGTVTLASGGQFIMGSGGNVGDLRIGHEGTGTLNVNAGGTFRNESGNWVWVGEKESGNGTINVDGGTFEITSGSKLNIGQNGTGTFRQTSGTTNVDGIIMAEQDGTASLDLQGGTVTIRSSFYLGGGAGNSSGNGAATVTQSGGKLEANGSIVLGLADGHSGSYTMTGGTVEHSGSDITVGENGSGVLTIGADATFNDTSTTSGHFFVGRNNGSDGVLTVHGELTKTGDKAIRVGNGNTDGSDNTDATGLLQGTGIISSESGVIIGAKGFVRGGSETLVGQLALVSNLTITEGGTLFAQFGGNGEVSSLNVTGTVALNGSILASDWLEGVSLQADERYWLILNDGNDAIDGTFANTIGTSDYAASFPGAEFVTMKGQEFAVFYDANYDTDSITGGNDLLLIVIPEPGTTLLVLLAGGLGLIRRRR